MADKNFEEALIIMDQLVARDPSDSDYLVGQKEARLGVIGQSLIKIRHTRLGNNINESLEGLRKVFEQQNSWNLFPTGAVAFTQNEETDEAYKNLRSEISSLDQKMSHLRILYMIERYKILFSENRRKSLDPQLIESKKHVRKTCLEKSKVTTSKTYFYNQFIDKLCRYVDQKAVIAHAEPELYNQINLKLDKQTHIPQSFITTLSALAMQKVKNSGWINSQSNQSMSVFINGDYFFREIQTRDREAHHYTETIKSTASDGTVTTKNEPQVFYYTVNIIKQNFETTLNFINSDILIGEFKNNYSDTSTRSYHDNKNYSIGLSPSSTGKTYTESEWQTKAAHALTNKYLLHLETIYDQKFCQTLSDNQPKVELLNQSLKCIRQTIQQGKNKPVPIIISRNFESEFGVNTTELQTLFKLID